MNRSMALDEFREKFSVAELIFFQTAHWTLSVRPDQITLGSAIISATEGALSFEECSKHALSELGKHFAMMERLAKELFTAVRLNILCLMMVDPVVHFHVFPRYDKSLEFADRLWLDTDWPAPVSIRTASVDDSVLHKLRDKYSTEVY